MRLQEVDGLTVAKRLSLPQGTLKNWAYAARQGKLAAACKDQKPLTEHPAKGLILHSDRGQPVLCTRVPEIAEVVWQETWCSPMSE